MSFLSGIVHDIGNIFGGGNNTPQKKKTPQPVQPAIQQQNRTTTPLLQKVPQNNNNQNNNGPIQLIAPSLTLTPLQKAQPKNAFGQNVPDASTLTKVSQIPAVQTTPNTPDNRSVIQKLTHNPVTNLVGSILKIPVQASEDYSNTFANLGNKLGGGKDQTIQQNMGGGSLLNNTLRMSAATGKNAQLAGDAAQIGTAAVAPGVDNLVERGASKVLPDAVSPFLQKLVPKVAGNSLNAGLFNTESEAANGGNVKQDLKAGGEGLGVGALFGVGTGLIKAPLTTPAENAAVNDADSASTTSTPAQDEVAVGVKSVNPNQAQDAIEQTGAKPLGVEQPEAPQNTGIPQVSAEAPNAKAPVLTVQPPEQLTQLPKIAEPNQQVVNGSEKVNTPIEPVKPPESQPVKVENVSSTDNNTAPNAPNIHAQAVKDLGDLGSTLADTGEHNVLSNADLKTAADRVVNSTAPESLLDQYKGVPKLEGASDLAHAHASLPKLAEIARGGDPEAAAAAKNAIDNIVQGAGEHVSASGRSLNYAQSMYDNLPKEAKISSTIRQLDKVREAAGMPKIADDVTTKAQVEANLDALISKGEDLKGNLAGTEGKIQAIQDAPASGTVGDLNTLGKEKAATELQSAIHNGETARYYDSLLPKKALTQRAAQFARTSMLTAPSGRINNVFNVGGNSLYEIARSIPQDILNRASNFVTRNPGSTTDSSLLNRGLVKGFTRGVKQVGSELRGNALVDNLQKATKDMTAGGNGTLDLTRTADNRGLNKISNITHALVKAPSNIIGGALKQADLVRLGDQAAAKAGYTGDEAKIYAQAASELPTKAMADKAQLLQDQVSHMNDNPFAKFAGGIFGDNSNKLGPSSKGVLGLVKNTFLPFPKYAATFAWNTLTDRNVLADTVKAAQAIKQGDMQGFTRAISGAAIDGTGMAVGYHLAKQGYITNKDANGYSDDGAYLHIGDRYIPLGILGVGAEGILAGSAMHTAVNSKGNPADNYVKAVGDTVLNTLKTAGTQSIVGAGDQGLTAIQDAMTGSDGVTPGDAAAVAGGQAVGQFIPGGASDLNSVLNQTNLNPTHEAALTKVQKTGLTPAGNPTTAKDIPKSEVNVLKNRVPFLSQTLSRNPAEASSDFVDRVTRGSHTGTLQKAAAEKALTATQKVQADLKNGIPVYDAPAGALPKGYSADNVVETSIEGKHYAKALTGLQNKLDVLNKTPNTPQTKKTPVENQIKQVGVLQAGNFDPSIRDLYTKTTLTEWRNMGDPTSDTYDPATYALLYKYDTDLAKTGISGSTLDPTDNKYLAKTPSTSSGSGRSAADKALTTAKSNTDGSTPTLGQISFSDLAPEKITDTIPTIQAIQPGQLIKKRAISVSGAPT